MQFDIEHTLGYALHHASYLFKTAMKTSFAREKIDISPEEFVALFLIGEEGIEQSVLCGKTKKDKTNLARLLARMEAKNLIKRSEMSDRRHQHIQLTDSGIQMKARLLPVVGEFIAQVTEGVSPQDLETTRITLQHLTQRFEDFKR